MSERILYWERFIGPDGGMCLRCPQYVGSGASEGCERCGWWPALHGSESADKVGRGKPTWSMVIRRWVHLCFGHPEGYVSGSRCRSCGCATDVACRLEPHTGGLAYDAKRDVMVCPLCGHEQYEEMGG